MKNFYDCKYCNTMIIHEKLKELEEIVEWWANWLESRKRLNCGSDCIKTKNVQYMCPDNL